MHLVAAALLIAAPAAVQDFAGLYRIDQMEMAGGLELQANGRFRYALDYGAVSEEGEGDWALDGGTIVLSTSPMPAKAECDRGYGSACFDRTPLTMENGDLILRRWDARIVLKPVQRAPSK